TVQSPTRVQAGDVLGQVGNTGQWSQFLEPHLHFSIANGHHDGYIWESDVHGAGFLAEHFGLDWRHRENSVYQPDEPRGWPFPEPGRIVQDFAQTSRVAREQGALLLAPPEPVLLRLAGDAQGESPEEQQRSLARVPVVSPMEGMISYSRDTIFGERIQIVNEHTGHLLVLFGVNVALRRSGLMVRRGQLLGWVSPGQPLRLQYFRGGRPRDYEPLLDSSRDLLE
ncbi:MAG: hypothetical protein D6B26_06780, partial [Spirochaetaceae bacterium]